MNSEKLLRYFASLALVLALVVTGCKDGDDPTNEPPVDTPPQITITEPTNGLALLQVGQSLSIHYQLFDNQLLNTYYVSTRIISVNGVEVQADTEFPGSRQALSTTSAERVFSYTVPNVQVFTTIEIRGHAIDNKGREAVVLFRVSVVPPSDAGSIYPIQEYTGDTLWSIYTGHDYYFDLINRRHGDQFEIPNAVDRHLQEDSPSGGANFVGVFSSPANFNLDSVLVLTNQTVFNYDSLTYQTIYEAFVTSNQIGTSAGDPIWPGDVILLKLPVVPHFAAIRIKEKNATDGYFVFDYKYTYN